MVEVMGLQASMVGNFISIETLRLMSTVHNWQLLLNYFSAHMA